MKNILIEEQIKRAIEIFGCKNQGALAKLLGISDTDFSNRKGRGSLIKVIEAEAYRRGLNVKYIINGPLDPQKVEEARQPYNHVQIKDKDKYTERAVTLAKKVMLSHHKEIGKALMKNLEEFAGAVDTADELDRCKIRLEEQDKKIAKMDIEIKNLKEQVAELLRRGPHCGSGTPGDGVPVPDEKAM